MMDKFLFLVLCLLVLAFPVSATDASGGDVDGTVSASDPAAATTDTASPEASVEGEEASEGIDLLASDGGLAGGYYFVCDCALGYDLMFYVPVEWAYDVFTLDSSGAPVNLSNSTCYAYCPDFPDYTFSCSRFGTFTYRATNYNTTDLAITDISDTNISFFDDSTINLSPVVLQVLSCAFLFVLVGLTVLKRGV